jgi:hypothetical protein
MIKLLTFFCLAVACSAGYAKPQNKSCATLASSGFVFSRPMKISEIERIQMEGMSKMAQIRPDLPKVPFAFGNAEWVAFKSRIRPGDKIVAYSTDSRSWKHLAGESGYALIRRGCFVEKFVTLMN